MFFFFDEVIIDDFVMMQTRKRDHMKRILVFLYVDHRQKSLEENTMNKQSKSISVKWSI